eukprot:TRINITY_DN16710_c0_g1_i1.p1 TRINITY_DN16710_c0_g1~~TRINITY_DN16710_c0_g1_i1.p1  ORF type:complete len:416 (+),score=63.97 TRINITY_DN16710_c0_g1_i1:192-1439(+)
MFQFRNKNKKEGASHNNNNNHTPVTTQTPNGSATVLSEEEIEALIGTFEEAECCDDELQYPSANTGAPPDTLPPIPKALSVAEKLKQMIDESQKYTSESEYRKTEMFISTREWLLTTNRCQFDESVFPPELMLNIFAYLDFRSLCRSAQVCRYWRVLALDKDLWYRLCHKIGVVIDRNSKESSAVKRDPYVAFLMAFKSGQLVDEPFGKSTLLTMSLAKHLHDNLPKRWGPGSTLVPLFSTSQHGWSFSALHSNVARQRDGPTIIVVKDENDWVFGCYASTQWRRASMDYYGTSECFLFQLFPYVKFFHHTPDCSNTNFMLSDPTGLYIGGYQDFPGLWISSDLLRGCSRQTTTFRSKPLCANLDGEFKIKGIEVYGIKSVEETTIFPVEIRFGYSARDGASTLVDLTSRVTHYN